MGGLPRGSIPGVNGTLRIQSRYYRCPPMPELLLSAQDLAKAFGAAPLFEGLSFGIFEGDLIGLVGPNGSGKTSLL
jgi:ABC-type polysaccharide/polyol phosphate transport system ATPase subunit